MPTTIKARAPRVGTQPQLLSVEDLTGGVDLRRSQTLVAPAHARTLLNQSLEEPGALIVRPGYVAASSASFGSNPQGGQRVYTGSTVFTLVALDGAVYKPTDAWVRGAAVYSTLSTANEVFFPHDRDIVAAMDAAARPRFSTNGSDWYLMGTDAPSSAATLSSLSTGGLSSGEFVIAYAYKHRGTGHLSNASSGSTITITASSGAITATASPSTDAKVDAYVWYARHRLPDNEGVLRKVSSGSSATVVITSSAWTSADEAPTTNNPPVTGLQFATVWKNRWWAPDGTVGNRLRFTEIFQPQSWPANYYIDIPFASGDSITAQEALGDTLLVHGQSGIFLVIGQTSLDFEVRPSPGASAGALGPRTTAKIEQSVTHVSAEDVSSFDGASDRSLAFDIQPALRDLVRNSASADLENIATVYDPLRKEFRMSVPRVYPTGARGEWILNLDRTRENEGIPAWTTTNRDIAFYIHWNGNEPVTGNRGRIFTIPSSGGVVFEENSSGSAANSSNLTATYEGPALTMGIHRGRVAGTYVEFEPHGGAFSIELVADGISLGSLTVPIGTGLYTYGSTAATYGTATYGGAGRVTRFVEQPLAAEGANFVLKGTYTGREQFKWFGYTHEVIPEPMPRRMRS